MTALVLLGAAGWELILGDLLMLVLAVGIVGTALSRGRKLAGTAQAEETVEAVSTE